MSRNRGRGFLATVAAAFLRLRRRHLRLRAAAVRGFNGPSGPARGELQKNANGARPDGTAGGSTAAEPFTERAATSTADGGSRGTRLSIVIMVVGSRGDVQPFIPIGRRLAQQHRVRLATHRQFRSMVEEAGLEFYPLAGDPRALMEYIVKTGGRIIPTHLKQLVDDVPKKRAMIAEILASTWRACTEPDPDRPQAPTFRADVILANPPSYGHIHCAEALHIPLHMIFTMPWSPTSAVPHPFAGIDPTEHGPVQNFMSYGLVDLLIWSGILDLVNAFREETLKLPAISLAEGAALLEDHEVPFTYLWPPRLTPKPADWGPHIDLANFTFHDQAHRYEPPPALLDFLAAGEAPIYIGFGSVIVEDPAALRRIVFNALEKAGARGIVSDGWAHLGGEEPPPNVFLIGDCPHDWLFPRCRAVCHHGGAGTTAAGLRAGLPTVVVPFFGDQFLWGHVVAEAGAAPPPIPFEQLDSDTLAQAFEMCRQTELRERANALGAVVRETDGAELAVRSVYRHLPVCAMSDESRPEHLATAYCDTCGTPLCRDCWHTSHAEHAVRPHCYVDWSARARRGIAGEIGELLGDAAQALRVGLVEVLPQLAPQGDRLTVTHGDERDGSHVDTVLAGDKPPG